MSPKRRGILFTILAAFLLGGAAILLTPLLGPARIGPMRGFRMGPMSFGMMREVHAMADVAVDHQRLQQLAADIRTTQTREIRRMSLWMGEWFR